MLYFKKNIFVDIYKKNSTISFPLNFTATLTSGYNVRDI